MTPVSVPSQRRRLVAGHATPRGFVSRVPMRPPESWSPQLSGDPAPEVLAPLRRSGTGRRRSARSAQDLEGPRCPGRFSSTKWNRVRRSITGRPWTGGSTGCPGTGRQPGPGSIPHFTSYSSSSWGSEPPRRCASSVGILLGPPTVVLLTEQHNLEPEVLDPAQMVHRPARPISGEVTAGRGQRRPRPGARTWRGRWHGRSPEGGEDRALSQPAGCLSAHRHDPSKAGRCRRADFAWTFGSSAPARPASLSSSPPPVLEADQCAGQKHQPNPPR